MAGLIGPTKTGTSFQYAVNKALARGKTLLQAKRLAGSTNKFTKKKKVKK